MTKEEEKVLLDTWEPLVKTAIKKLHKKFKGDSKFILTESDLKCWLFYYLQKQKPYTTYAVHTEVTHYAPHINKKNVPEKIFKFRDLSLLCPWKIKDNEEFLTEGTLRKDILSKGFKHQAPAMHFELKFIRQGVNLDSLKIDIEKISEYSPTSDSAQRRLVLVWGSRSGDSKCDKLKKELLTNLKKFHNKKLNNILDFYLFSDTEIIHAKWNGHLKDLEFNPL